MVCVCRVATKVAALSNVTGSHCLDVVKRGLACLALLLQYDTFQLSAMRIGMSWEYSYKSLSTAHSCS